MSTALVDFVTDLQEDPAKYRNFWGEPADAMASAGLSDVEQQAVLGGDGDALRGLLDPTHTGVALAPVVIAINFYKTETSDEGE